MDTADPDTGTRPPAPALCPFMSHEWRALTGCSPRDWIAKQLPFVQDYELAGGDAERIQR